MTNHWKRFLIYRLPMAIFALVVIVEIIATLLSDTPQLRHPLDRLILSMTSIENGGDVVLIGDSVTQDVAGQYALAPGNRIVNLTTNQASGMTGAYLLLRRHMEINHPPRHIVIAATPEFFGYSPTPQTARIYLSSVFTTPEEQRYLRTIGLASPQKKIWKPAILEIEDRIFNRVTNLLFQSFASNNISYLSPPSEAPLEAPGGNAASHAAMVSRLSSPLNISKSARRAIEGICALSRLHNFKLHIITAPTPKSVHLEWESDSRVSKFRNLIGKIAGPTCQNATITDINEIARFPDHAFRDSDHLRRPGWATLYARVLRDFIAELK
jgi:hypothetical protein